MSRHPVLRVLLVGLAVLFVVATALPLIREPYWWIRIFDFPRAQLTVLGVVRARARGGFPRTEKLVGEGPPGAPRGERRVPALADVAVHPAPQRAVGRGRSPRRRRGRSGSSSRTCSSPTARPSAGSAWCRRPTLTSSSCSRRTRGGGDEVQPLRDELPHAVEHPLDNTYGILVYSRWPLRDAAVRTVVEDSIPSVWGTL